MYLNWFFCLFLQETKTFSWKPFAHMSGILEYNSPVWSPHRKSLIDRIEKIQKRFTKAIPTLSPHPYMQRLKLLKLPSLEKGRLLADLSLCFKIKNHLIHTTIPLISSNCYRTRGHNHKLTTGKFRCETSKHFFCNRIVKPWNSLPVDIVNSSTLTRFNSAILQLNFNQYLTFKELYDDLILGTIISKLFRVPFVCCTIVFFCLFVYIFLGHVSGWKPFDLVWIK